MSDTNEETGREGTDSTVSKREEQTESVIETEHIGEELLAQCTRSDEEAGSVVLHVSGVMNEKEKGDEEADETAAANEIEEMEIRRLIEERRNTPKEEKQRLKEVSKRKKMYQGQKKNEKTARHPTNTRRLQRGREHPRNQICKEKSAHHQDKE